MMSRGNEKADSEFISVPLFGFQLISLTAVCIIAQAEASAGPKR